jgi:hypothetical protein
MKVKTTGSIMEKGWSSRVIGDASLSRMVLTMKAAKRHTASRTHSLLTITDELDSVKISGSQSVCREFRQECRHILNVTLLHIK